MIQNNLKIATWNINSIRMRLDILRQLISENDIDVICVQETKVVNELFPIEELRLMGYPYCVFDGQKSYHGVAICSKFPILDQFSLSLYNEEKRHIACSILGVELHNFYVPAGGDEPDIDTNPKYQHKLSYVELMREWFLSNRCLSTDKIIILGDLNIAPYEHDVWSSKQLSNVISHTDIERKLLHCLRNDCGFIDTARHIFGYDQKLYSWWSYRNRDWKKSNRGRRLDHIWVSKNLQHNILGVECIKDVRDYDKPSDHVPYVANIKI